jgi:ubiquinone/menaquinone biosynthesis C-methylase UbiE
MRTPEQARAAWDQIAAGDDQFVTPSHLSLAEDALQRVDLRTGMRFLDVAAGTGALSIPAARLGAQVTATDISPTMVARLNQRAREAGLANIHGRVMDAHDLDLEDDAFDIAASQYGVMLVPDLPRALREMVRVTRPGGRVLVIAFGPPAQVEFLSFFLGAIKTVVPDFRGLPLDPPPLPFQLADPEKFRREMENAGLHEISVESLREEMAFQSAVHLWDWVTHSHPIGAGLVAGLTAAQALDVQNVLGGLLRDRAGGGTRALLTNAAHIGIGIK